jgi:hypothetical protein
LVLGPGVSGSDIFAPDSSDDSHTGMPEVDPTESLVRSKHYKDVSWFVKDKKLSSQKGDDEDTHLQVLQEGFDEVKLCNRCHKRQNSIFEALSLAHKDQNTM